MLRLEHVSRRFGPTLAVDDVTLSIERGEVVGLVGENGAGKTTLMRIVAGELGPDAGRVSVDGPVGMVHQHFAIVEAFTIAENLALGLGRRFISPRSLHSAAQQMIDESGIALSDIGRRAGDLSVGEKAKLELIKALAADPQLLVLDEPTSVLTPLESDELFRLLPRLAQRGKTVVFISHKVPEVLQVARRVVVMRQGRIVADEEDMTAKEIAAAMVGHLMGEPPPPRPPITEGASTPLLSLPDLNLTVHRGEVVAVVGVAGNGQVELAAMLRGLRIPGSAFIPEDRTRHGLVAEMTIAENLSLGARSWRPADAVRQAERLMHLYDIRARGPQQQAGELSGGNQQKVVLARELDRRPELIVASEPTRGLDIAAMATVHQQLRASVRAGAGLLLMTSDLDEAFALADRVHVIYRGRLTPALTPAEAAARVGPLMAGLA